MRKMYSELIEFKVVFPFTIIAQYTINVQHLQNTHKNDSSVIPHVCHYIRLHACENLKRAYNPMAHATSAATSSP